MSLKIFPPATPAMSLITILISQLCHSLSFVELFHLTFIVKLRHSEQTVKFLHLPTVTTFPVCLKSCWTISAPVMDLCHCLCHLDLPAPSLPHYNTVFNCIITYYFSPTGSLLLPESSFEFSRVSSAYLYIHYIFERKGKCILYGFIIVHFKKKENVWKVSQKQSKLTTWNCII